MVDDHVSLQTPLRSIRGIFSNLQPSVSVVGLSADVCFIIVKWRETARFEILTEMLMNTQGHGLFDTEDEGTALLRNVETA